MQIRQFVASDWPQVWPILEEVISARETFTFDPDWTPHEAHEVWVEVPPGLTVVACEGEAILGTAKMGTNRPGPGSHVATASFMVARTASGKGVGTSLTRYALEWARQRDYSAMQFNAVVESNHGAVELYKNFGFTVIGTVPEAFHHPTAGRVGLHVMHRLL